MKTPEVKSRTGKLKVTFLSAKKGYKSTAVKAFQILISSKHFLHKWQKADKGRCPLDLPYRTCSTAVVQFIMLQISIDCYNVFAKENAWITSTKKPNSIY